MNHEPILAEMKLGPLERSLAPFNTSFRNSDPDTLKHLNCKTTGRPLRNEVWGDVEERNQICRSQRKREKEAGVPQGPGQGLGGGPPGQGGNDYPETPPVVDREGGDNLLGLFLGDPFVDYLAAEQTGKRGAAYSLYIYICVCVCLYLELGIGSNLSSTPLGPGSQSEMVKACLPPVPEFEPLQPGEGHDSTQCGAAEWHQETVTHPGTRRRQSTL